MVEVKEAARHFTAQFNPMPNPRQPLPISIPRLIALVVMGRMVRITQDGLDRHIAKLNEWRNVELRLRSSNTSLLFRQSLILFLRVCRCT